MIMKKWIRWKRLRGALRASSHSPHPTQFFTLFCFFAEPFVGKSANEKMHHLCNKNI
jgi:hypothetical protein